MVKEVKVRNIQKLNVEKGFTLIEVIAVLVIISILAVIAIPSIVAVVEKAKAAVCNSNSIELERAYERHLVLGDLEHTEVLFVNYLRDFDGIICPENGWIMYNNGKINCTIHGDQVEHDEEDIPFL